MWFDAASATLKPIPLKQLKRAADALRADPSMRLEICGHTAPDEPRELGQSRAEAARDWLVAEGVAADRLVLRNAGPDDPYDTNQTEQGRAKNRRIKLTPVPP
jgi:outer membrane protein OmpA-like peptidoglycan-associated protein